MIRLRDMTFIAALALVGAANVAADVAQKGASRIITTDKGFEMDQRKGICIGGPYDGKYFAGATTVVTRANMKFNTDQAPEAAQRPLDVAYSDYRYEAVYVSQEVVLYFWRHDSLTITAALHRVFAAYAKKGKN